MTGVRGSGDIGTMQAQETHGIPRLMYVHDRSLEIEKAAGSQGSLDLGNERKQFKREMGAKKKGPIAPVNGNGYRPLIFKTCRAWGVSAAVHEPVERANINRFVF